MKKTFLKYNVFVFIVFISIIFSFQAFAHSGGTDSEGGHYDHYTNEYHYHHGHPAHDHNNGECPYMKANQESEEKNDLNFIESLFASIIIGGWFGGALLLAVLFWPLTLLLRDFFADHLFLFHFIFSIITTVLMFVYVYILN